MRRGAWRRGGEEEMRRGGEDERRRGGEEERRRGEEERSERRGRGEGLRESGKGPEG
jgi:hypothetical protein